MLTLYITIKINRAIGAQTLIVRHAPGSICKWSNYDMLFIGWHNALQILRIKIFSQQLSTCPSWGGQPAFGTSMQLVSGGQMSLIPNHSLYNMILYTRINFQKHTLNNITNNIINRQSYWNRGLCNEQANKTSMLSQKSDMMFVFTTEVCEIVRQSVNQMHLLPNRNYTCIIVWLLWLR